MSYLVMDVSQYNSVTDWSSVSTQIDGVIIRCGYRGYSSGTIVQDSSFTSHIEGAVDAGIPVSIYFFSQAITADEAVEEANYVLEKAGSYTLGMPIFIDSEYSNTDHDGRADSLSASDRTTIVSAFCDQIIAGGYTAGIYASDSWFNSQLVQSSLSSDYRKWVARYSTSAPQYVEDYVGWQYTSSGSITGVDGNCDLSYWYGTISGSSGLPEVDADATYYETYTGSSDSLIEALSAVGCLDTTYKYRCVIAAANDITGYSGTATQNTYMLTLLKNGLLIDPSGNDTTGPIITVVSNTCGTLTFTVTDDVYVSSVVVDVTSFSLVDQYTLTGAGQDHAIYATDAAGNQTILEVSVNGHNYEKVVTEPTCTTGGYTTWTCSVCGDSYTGDETAATGHSYVNTVIEPTCTTDGYTLSTCSNCGYSITSNLTSATGHDYEDVVTDPTCTTMGYTTHTCNNCGDTYISDYVDALGHDYQLTDSQEVTCTEDGYETYTCSRGDDTYTDEYEATGHNYELSEASEPTCTTAGYVTYTCSNCGDSYTEIINALGHDYQPVYTWAEDYSTCTLSIVCSRCGSVEYTAEMAVSSAVSKGETCTEGNTIVYIATLVYDGTTYSDAKTITTEGTDHEYESEVYGPTCTEEGYTLYTCINCGNSYKDDYTPATGHTTLFSPTFEWAEDYSSCTATYTCANCEEDIIEDCSITLDNTGTSCETGGTLVYTAEVTIDGITYTDSQTVEIEAQGHDFVFVETVEATCEEEGYDLYMCRRCGNSYKNNIVAALGHDFVLITSQEATCEERGYEQYECSRCGYSKLENVTDPLGHSYEDVITDPTCTEQGYTTHTCTRCGHIVTDTYVAALGHDWVLTDSETPDYINEGYNMYTCNNCGETYTEVLDTLAFELGESVEVVDTNLYAIPLSRDPETTISGTFYIWKDTSTNGRIKVTNRADNAHVAGLITGWIDVADIGKTIVTESGTKYGVGDKIYAKSLNVYETHSSTKVTAIISGTYYVTYSYKVNNRIALTDSEDYLGNEEYIIGWTKTSDL